MNNSDESALFFAVTAVVVSMLVVALISGAVFGAIAVFSC